MNTDITETRAYPNMPQGANIPSGDINQGTVLVESQRAIAEAQGKLVIAKKFRAIRLRHTIASWKHATERALLKKRFTNTLAADPRAQPLYDFCSSGQSFATDFLQIPRHHGHPCLWLYPSH